MTWAVLGDAPVYRFMYGDLCLFMDFVLFVGVRVRKKDMFGTMMLCGKSFVAI